MARKPKVTFKASDRRKLEREVKKQVERKIVPALEKQVRDNVRKMLNGMAGEFAGHPVDAIKPVLEQRFAETTHGGSITDPELTDYAGEISRGGSFT